MRSFYHTVIVVLASLFLFAPARAEEPRFVPQVDTAAIKTSMDVYHAKQWSNSRRYERKQEVSIRYYRLGQEVKSKYYGQDREALKVVRAAANEAYLQWLDAREMMEWERATKIEAITPEFQTYRAEVKKNDQARDEELAILEEEEKRLIAEIESVYEAEIQLIEQAKASQ